MSDETEHVTEVECTLCRDLNPAQRAAMRAQLIVIPFRDPVCDGCVEAFTANLFAGFPKTEEEEDAEAGGDGAAPGIGRRGLEVRTFRTMQSTYRIAPNREA
jgi:hypothetical protein